MTLYEAGFEVNYLVELAGGSNDDAVIQMVLQYDYILLTEDKDLGEWAFVDQTKDLSVLFVRYSFSEFVGIT